MSAEIEIISAGTDQVEQIAPLFDAYRVWYGRTSDLNGARNFLSQRLRQGESVIFLAKSDGRPVGFTQLYPLFSSVSMGSAWLLNDLFVVESMRRCGVGTELLEAAAEFGRQTGALRLHLQTAPDNSAAQAVYQRHGWVRDDEYLCFTLNLA
ncbi:MAG: GNAT family N-acetyltransferase [Fuerstiella sp.]